MEKNILSPLTPLSGPPGFLLLPFSAFLSLQLSNLAFFHFSSLFFCTKFFQTYDIIVYASFIAAVVNKGVPSTPRS